MFRTPCSNCKHRLKYDVEHLGHKVKCPKCGHRFALPSKPPVAQRSLESVSESKPRPLPPATPELLAAPPKAVVESIQVAVAPPAPEPVEAPDPAAELARQFNNGLLDLLNSSAADFNSAFRNR